MATPPLLSKTLFQRGRECPKRMWLDHHEPSLKPSMSQAEKARMQEGIDVGKLAQALYPGGVTAKYVGETDEMAALKTRELMDEGAQTIFEATFVAGDRVVRCDVLRRDGDGGWIVDEVKASTFEEGKKPVKPEHVHDVAYQMAALRKCGIEVKGGGLVVLDKTYAWDGGAHNLERLFTRVDLTADCETLREQIEEEAGRLGAHLIASEAPEAEINTHCKKCDYAGHCLRELPKDDLIYMIQARRTHVDKWRAAGYRTLRDIPEEMLTDRRMVPTHRVLTTGEPWVSADLCTELAKIRLPAAFIDFESCQPAVPAYIGTAPYTQVCFQWSCHLLGSAEAAPAHSEFLHCDGGDPRPEFCRTLWEAIRDAESVVIYSAFETARVREMATAGIPFAAELLEKLETATVDLEKIVAGHVCLEAFKYRTSIKTVLPALVPSMSYEGLAIADGTAAMTEFRRMVAPSTDPQCAQGIRQDLLAYCKQDTLAMVEVYRALTKLAYSTAP